LWRWGECDITLQGSLSKRNISDVLTYCHVGDRKNKPIQTRRMDVRTNTPYRPDASHKKKKNLEKIREEK